MPRFFQQYRSTIFLFFVLFALQLAASASPSSDEAGGLESGESEVKDGVQRYLLILDQQLDSKQMAAELEDQGYDIGALHRIIVEELTYLAEMSQRPVLERLDELKSSGLIGEFKPYHV